MEPLAELQASSTEVTPDTIDRFQQFYGLTLRERPGISDDRIPCGSIQSQYTPCYFPDVRWATARFEPDTQTVYPSNHRISPVSGLVYAYIHQENQIFQIMMSRNVLRLANRESAQPGQIEAFMAGYIAQLGLGMCIDTDFAERIGNDAAQKDRTKLYAEASDEPVHWRFIKEITDIITEHPDRIETILKDDFTTVYRYAQNFAIDRLKAYLQDGMTISEAIQKYVNHMPGSLSQIQIQDYYRKFPQKQEEPAVEVAQPMAATDSTPTTTIEPEVIPKRQLSEDEVTRLTEMLNNAQNHFLIGQTNNASKIFSLIDYTFGHGYALPQMLTRRMEILRLGVDINQQLLDRNIYGTQEREALFRAILKHTEEENFGPEDINGLLHLGDQLGSNDDSLKQRIHSLVEYIKKESQLAEGTLIFLGAETKTPTHLLPELTAQQLFAIEETAYIGDCSIAFRASSSPRHISIGIPIDPVDYSHKTAELVGIGDIDITFNKETGNRTMVLRVGPHDQEPIELKEGATYYLCRPQKRMSPDISTYLDIKEKPKPESTGKNQVVVTPIAFQFDDKMHDIQTAIEVRKEGEELFIVVTDMSSDLSQRPSDSKRHHGTLVYSDIVPGKQTKLAPGKTKKVPQGNIASFLNH